jgi:hypothetical protein
VHDTVAPYGGSLGSAACRSSARASISNYREGRLEASGAGRAFWTRREPDIRATFRVPAS